MKKKKQLFGTNIIVVRLYQFDHSFFIYVAHAQHNLIRNATRTEISKCINNLRLLTSVLFVVSLSKM